MCQNTQQLTVKHKLSGCREALSTTLEMVVGRLEEQKFARRHLRLKGIQIRYSAITHGKWAAELALELRP